MSVDDQQFLDVLSSIPNEVKKYSGEVAEYIDSNVEKLAEAIRSQLAVSSWIPESIRPRLPAQVPHLSTTITPSSTYDRVSDWVSRHKVLTGIVVLATGTIVYRSYKRSRFSRRTRKAKRARNGSRTEVIVIAGSPTLPLTRSLSLDMERKGFIVYIVCNSIEDELVVKSLSRPDVRPLSIDITDPPQAGASIDRFSEYLRAPHSAGPGIKRSHLSLTSVILIPALSYQTSPIATIPPSSFADLFNTHLLHPILMVQAFLPLLTARTSSAADTPAPKVLVFTPSIISSINPPFHAPEATVCSALSAFTDVLTGELRPLGIPVTHMQLGTFDFAGFSPNARGDRSISGLLPAPPNETLGWPDAARAAYARNYVAQSGSALGTGRVRGLRGSALRDLHNAVFDVLDGSDSSGVVRIGLGADLYGFVGRWAPRGLVSWMMGIRRVDQLASWHEGSSRGSSSRSGSDSEEGRDYVDVHDGRGGSNVWTEGE